MGCETLNGILQQYLNPPSPEKEEHVSGETTYRVGDKVMQIMETKKKIPVNTITRDIKHLAEPTGNIYESVVVLYKRANQIALAEKKELQRKLEDFRNDRETMEEVFENKEQIEISKYYERQPKPDLVAISEFENGELYYRNAGSEEK